MLGDTIGCGLWNFLKPSFWSPTDASPAPSPENVLTKEGTEGLGERPVDETSREESPSRASIASSSSTAAASLTVEVSDIDPKAALTVLKSSLQPFRKQLVRLANQLKAGAFKSLLLNTQEQNFLKDKIKTLEQLIETACQVAQKLSLNYDQQGLNQLTNLIGEIEKEQTSISLPADSPHFKLLRELAILAVGAAGMLWTFALKVGLLVATTTLVTWLPFVAGLSLILIRAGWLIKIYIIDEKKLEDKRTLITIHQSLIQNLKEFQEKMDSMAILGLVDTNRELNQKVDQLVHEKMDSMAILGLVDTSRELNQKVDQLVQQLSQQSLTNTSVGGKQQATGPVTTVEQALDIVGTPRVNGASSQSTISKSAAVDQLLESVAQQLVENGVDEKEAFMVATQFNQKLQEALESKKQRQEVEAALVTPVDGATADAEGKAITSGI